MITGSFRVYGLGFWVHVLLFVGGDCFLFKGSFRVQGLGLRIYDSDLLGGLGILGVWYI